MYVGRGRGSEPAGRWRGDDRVALRTAPRVYSCQYLSAGNSILLSVTSQRADRKYLNGCRPNKLGMSG
ncbi:hypothetical protein J6590_018627 [Homalodisca vitripennis]|nr:hypothetical protein J6590_018627 [Homalodisca vitripennis]